MSLSVSRAGAAKLVTSSGSS